MRVLPARLRRGPARLPIGSGFGPPGSSSSSRRLGAPRGGPSTAFPDGTQVKRKVGPAWTGRGRPAPATSRSGWPRTGCTTRSRRSGASGRSARPTAAGVDPASVRIRGYGSVRRDVRRRRGRVPALLGAGPRLQALDGPQLPQRDQRPPAAGVRRDGARGHHRAGDRALARGDVQRPPAARALEQDQEQPARPDARDLQARGQALRAAGESGGERRSLPRPEQRRHPGVLARGGLEPGPRGRVPRRTRRSS